MTKEEFIQNLIFDSDEDKIDCEKYVRIKGLYPHTRILNMLKSNEALYQETKVSYASIKAVYKYDKRLRDTIFIYVAVLEEFIRAKIGNEYFNKPDDLDMTKPLKEAFENKKNLFEALEELTIKELIEQQNRISTKQGKYERKNLEAINLLRNAVLHHNFLITKEFALCLTELGESNTLKANLLNMKSFLPEEFQNGFVTSINKCSLDKQGKEIEILKNYAVKI